MQANKLFATLCGGAMLMSMASCSNHEDLYHGHDANHTQEVNFCAQLPGNMTRAFADGLTAKNLTCYVYEVEGEGDATTNKYVTTVTAEKKMDNKEGSVNVRLTTGVAYKLIFWAESENSPYTINTATGEVSVNYESVKANSEDNDAFYNVVDFVGGQATEYDVQLKRPFAQINFGTDDLGEAVVKSTYGEKLDKLYTTVTVDTFTTLNLFTGNATGDKRFTTPVALVNTLKEETFPVSNETYGYTNMLYVVTPATGHTSLLTFNVYKSEDTTGKAVSTLSVPSAPLGANYRTNVYGSLLTSFTNFKVTVLNNFNEPLPEHNLLQK